MAHGENAKPIDGEWWGKRAIGYFVSVPRKTGKKSGYWWWKRFLHKKERQQGKLEARAGQTGT